MTTREHVGIVADMKAVQLVHTRITYSEAAFSELVLWQVPKPVTGSDHGFKYRLAYVVLGECFLRYDNEVGKGDHRHFGGEESVYSFTTPDQLIADFQQDIARWDDENRNS
ncbi:MAG: toxin-antitoxin system TumE family protein [Methylococcales bacterium]